MDQQNAHMSLVSCHNSHRHPIDEHSQPDTASRSLTAVAARPRGTAHIAHPHASPAHRSLTRLSLTAALTAHRSPASALTSAERGTGYAARSRHTTPRPLRGTL